MIALRPYEILVIVDPRPSDEEVATLLTQVGEQLKGLGGEITKVENWGKRRLAYDTRKQREGTYAVFEASAEPSMVKEFERQLRLNENVLRYLSTRVPVRSKKARLRAAAAAAAQQEPPATGEKALEEVV
ncbi:MAG TPA: 30S ribosomal protein S6 [Methylomirabilota bacterium]|nr:30S ribosomal protein S6 [Methylomirabilota bacterium]